MTEKSYTVYHGGAQCDVCGRFGSCVMEDRNLCIECLGKKRLAEQVKEKRQKAFDYIEALRQLIETEGRGQMSYHDLAQIRYKLDDLEWDVRRRIWAREGVRWEPQAR